MKQILIVNAEIPSGRRSRPSTPLGYLIDSMVAHELNFDVYLIFGRRCLRFNHVRMRCMTSTGPQAEGIFLKVEG